MIEHVHTQDLQSSYISSVQTAYRLDNLEDLDRLTNILISEVKNGFESKLQILKSKFTIQFDLKCQENFEDHKT